MPTYLGGTSVMEELLVYHGGTEIVERPICSFGRLNLDFGQGFYVTDLKEQAIQWAKTVAGRKKLAPLVNRYRLCKAQILREARCRIFEAYDAEWLEFIVASRQGKLVADAFDYIEGGVANDRVIDTINLYMAGLMDREMALRRLSMHKPNNQMCLLNQKITDNYLIYEGFEQL